MERPYELTISRLTVDKLGVKLYDKASAVVAELIANCYDADAENVTVRLPLNTLLARGVKESERKVKPVEQPEDFGYVIEVDDDGHGMTPDEAIDFYLQVGRDRRHDDKLPDGGRSREKKRPVMGRKGIGKLAPFGICRQIEVISGGGPKTGQGYQVAHFTMDYDEIHTPSERPVPLKVGVLDRTFQQKRGTLIRLKRFAAKRVPDEETFHRQLATRFYLARPDFKITVEDTRNPGEHPPKAVSHVNVAIDQNTRIDLSARPLFTEDNTRLPVTGWLAMAKDSYKYEETAGVRIYARGKIVATTRDFEQPAGFTGEFTIRSYLVGEVFAEWLDWDEEEDLIRSDRQGILWDSDYGRALRTWGADLIKEIGKMSKEPRRKRAREIFLQRSGIEQKARETYSDTQVAKVAVDLAKQIGSFAAEDELEDEEYVQGLMEVILSVAPHKALMEAFQEFSQELVGGKEIRLDSLLALFGKERIAEMASYSQIASHRVRVIRELEKIVRKDSDESELQKLITEAPWLIEPTWTVIATNQRLKTVKTALEAYLQKRLGHKVSLAIEFAKKRPDFTLVSVGDRLHIVEIKAPGHAFDDADMKRLGNYLDAFDEFFEKHEFVRKEFPEGYRIALIVDDVGVKDPNYNRAFKAARKDGKLAPQPWEDFLAVAKKAHEQFLEISDRFNASRFSHSNSYGEANP
jgi:hypothetical protein